MKLKYSVLLLPFMTLCPKIGLALPCRTTDIDSVVALPAAETCFLSTEEHPVTKSPAVDTAVENSEFFDNPMGLSLSDENVDDDSAYWQDWLTQEEDSAPVLTESLDSSYFGIGVWLPSEIEEQARYMSTDEWIMNHGLKFSFGLGEKEAGKPRMRFDYRWHNEYDGDVMVQVEVPF